MIEQAVFLSPRNSDEAQAHLLTSTKATHYLYSEGMNALLEPFQTLSNNIPGHQIPTYNDMVIAGKTGGFNGIGNQALEAQVLVLHSSGSTGLPQPIHVSNAWLMSFDLVKRLKLPEGRTTTSRGLYCNGYETLFAPCPYFHTLGIAALMHSILSGPLLISPVERRLDSGLVHEILSLRKAGSIVIPPSVLAELAETSEGLQALSTVGDISYGGAPLPKEAGDRIIGVTRLHPIYGSTEAACICMMDPEDSSDWQYYEWHPSSGAVMEDAGEGLSELVIKRTADWPTPTIFYTFPNIEEWRTKDLWEPHPTKPGLWRYSGRRDDVIVFSNGEKFTPLSFEAIIESHPLVRGALVVGQQRFQAGLLIEPSQFEDPDILLETLWPLVEKANQSAPGHAKVWKNKIAFAKKEKPFARAAKGSIQRRSTYQLYDREISALYTNERLSERVEALSKGTDLSGIHASVRNTILIALPFLGEDITDDMNLFDHGVDSLSVLALSSALGHGLKAGGAGPEVAVAPRDVYDNPTIRKLAGAIFQKLNRTDLAKIDSVSREEAMAAMVKKYTKDLVNRASHTTVGSAKKRVVVLTGSTGSLGTYMLRDLINSSVVAQIYCLNRSETAESRQKQAFENAGIPVDFSKVKFLHTDFSLERFGLSRQTYDELLSKVTTFIHNAWAVNFNHPLEAFEDTHIAGVRRIIDFSVHSQFRTQIIFISSIASVGNWPNVRSGPVPEKFFEDDRMPLPQGYGESKHVAGRILAHAAQHSGVPVSIVRCGQLAGPLSEEGVWNRHEWLPSLVHTSKNMGILPSNLGNQDRIDWVPIDAASRTVLQIAAKRRETQENEPLDTFHVINPQIISWSDLVPVIQEAYKKQGVDIEAVPFDKWMEALRAIPLTRDEVSRKPGVKLIDFYDGLRVEGGSLPPMCTEHTTNFSQCLKTLPAVNAKIFGMWIQQWQF